jgi:probable F420-dependent oxidoreductase
MRGHHYKRPLDRMTRCLDTMDAAPIQAPVPAIKPVRILAALGPQMLELAAQRSAGALTYLVTPEHTAMARSVFGSDPLLAVEQAAVVTTDPTTARRIGRRHLKPYLGLPNYVRNWKQLGFTDEDVTDAGAIVSSMPS